MSIAIWSDKGSIISAACIVCNQEIIPAVATIASEHRDGRPAMACEMHRSNKMAWLGYLTTFCCQEGVPRIKNSSCPKPVLVDAGKLYVELRAKSVSELKDDIGWHLFTRSMVGRSIIISDRPIEFLSALRKQWKKIITLVRLERARTFNTSRKAALDAVLSHFHSLKFTSSVQRLDVDVAVASAHNILLPHKSATLYLCAALAEEQKLAIIGQLKKDALIVEYVLA